MHYHSRVKAEYQRQFLVEVTEYNKLSEEAKKQLKGPPRSVNVCQRVGLKIWGAEEPAFRDRIALAAKEWHKQETKEWTENLEVPESAEGFHK